METHQVDTIVVKMVEAPTKEPEAPVEPSKPGKPDRPGKPDKTKPSKGNR
jgi:hypothetical protein